MPEPSKCEFKNFESYFFENKLVFVDFNMTKKCRTDRLVGLCRSDVSCCKIGSWCVAGM